GETAAVGRDHRTGVGRRIVRSQVRRLRGTVDGGAIDVEVRAPRLTLAGDAHREEQLLAVRGETELAVVAERLGRDVPVDAATDQRRLAGSLAVRAELGGEQLVAAAVGPGVPVPHENLVEQLAGVLLRRALVEALLRASEVAAVGEHLE